MAGGSIGLITSDMEGFPNVVLEMLASRIDVSVRRLLASKLEERDDHLRVVAAPRAEG